MNKRSTLRSLQIETEISDKMSLINRKRQKTNFNIETEINRRQVPISLTDTVAVFSRRRLSRLTFLRVLRLQTKLTLWKPPVQMLNTKEMTDTTFCTR